MLSQIEVPYVYQFLRKFQPETIVLCSHTHQKCQSKISISSRPLEAHSIPLRIAILAKRKPLQLQLLRSRGKLSTQLPRGSYNCRGPRNFNLLYHYFSMRIGVILSKNCNKDDQNYAGLRNYSCRAETRLTVYRAIEVDPYFFKIKSFCLATKNKVFVSSLL